MPTAKHIWRLQVEHGNGVISLSPISAGAYQNLVFAGYEEKPVHSHEERRITGPDKSELSGNWIHEYIVIVPFAHPEGR